MRHALQQIGPPGREVPAGKRTTRLRDLDACRAFATQLDELPECYAHGAIASFIFAVVAEVVAADVELRVRQHTRLRDGAVGGEHLLRKRGELGVALEGESDRLI